ncbi:MAG: PHP domain-containing protein [Dehalococcoidia bacterium]
MGSSADFHCHSTYSDGRLTPAEVVALAARRGVRILALTDHDITDGIPEAQAAAQEHPDMQLVPGVELSTDLPGSEVHVLGLFLGWQDDQFQATLTHFRRSRLERGRRMVERLANLEVCIPWERVQAIAGPGAVGRPHIAQAMVEGGYVATIKEAFDHFIGRNGPAYVERERLSPAEAVRLVVGVRGLPVLAHPRDLGCLDELLAELKGAGLVGMEVYYQDYDGETIERLLTAAQRHGLLPLGGSDYHGLGGEQEREPGDIPLPAAAAERFLTLAQERSRL